MANLLGSLKTMIFGAAIGRATSDSVTPVLEPVRQHAWTKNQVRVLDPSTAAEARAKGIMDETSAEDDASRSGVGVDRFGVLLRLAQEWPGLGELDRLSNRKLIDPAAVIEALTRSGYPGDLIGTVAKPGPLVELFQDILSPGELAAAIHRGLIPDPGILIGEQPTGLRKVKSYPVQKIDALAEAAGSGFDPERLKVLVGLQGLPMGVIEAAQAYYRGIITHGDYIAAFNESNNRNEWAEAVLEYAQQIPTARDFFENALRGYHDLAWAQDQAKRHGMSPEDSLVIYQNQGRPMNIHAITQALARGAKFNPEPGEIKDPYHAAIVEGNLKPGYYEMAESLKYTLPSIFTMRSLAESGVWSEAKTAERLKWAGWLPADADEAAKAWSGGGGATADSHVAKAQTQLWTTTHASYKAREIAAGTAATALAKAGVTAAAVPTVLDIWNAERDLIRARLQASDIRKAYQKQDENPATGAAWTRPDAIAQLISLGWSNEDADAYLNIG